MRGFTDTFWGGKGKMIEESLFDLLVRYHCEKNLPRCLPFIGEGQVHNPNGRVLKEGMDQNLHYKGLLIVADGNTLFQRLYQDGLINFEMDEFRRISNRLSFFNYLGTQPNRDGTYIYDGVQKKMTRVFALHHNPSKTPKGLRLDDFIPADFMSTDGNIPLEGNRESKTGFAIRLTQAYDNCQAYQIKRTAYTSLGMGKVIHLNKQGLVEEFFLEYNQRTKGIMGVYRDYGCENGRLVRHNERRSEVLCHEVPRDFAPVPAYAA